MPRVVRRDMDSGQKTDTALESRSRDDYTYVAILKAQRNAIELSLGIDSEKYGYRDFSSFSKNIFGYYIEQWEKSHRILDAKDFSVSKVLEGGSRYGVPYSSKQSCQCDCHSALEILNKIKTSVIRDKELIDKLDQQQIKNK